MRSYKRSASKPVPQPNYSYTSNPEEHVPQIVKMQNLLEEYDRENSFLNRQIVQLLSQNKVLTENNTNLRTQKTANAIVTKERKRASDHKRVKAYNYLQEADSLDYQNTSVRRKDKDERETNSKSRFVLDSFSPRRTTTQNQSPPKQKKQVKFTKDPYIQTSDVRTISPPKIQKDLRRDDGENSPLRKRSPLRKSGIHVTKYSPGKENSDEIPLFQSKLSLNRSRKSGIEVVSSQKKIPIEEERSPEKGKKQLETEKKVDTFVQTQNVLHQNQEVKPRQKKEDPFVYSFTELEDPKSKIIKQSMQKRNMNQVNIIGNPKQSPTQPQGSSNYSQHQIQPSEKVHYETREPMIRQQTRGRRSKSKTGKFLSIVSSSTAKQKANK